MIPFIASLVITGLMVAVVVLVARRRPPRAPMTWGEAFLAGTFMFALMLMFYGVVPNQWLGWADNGLTWRSDKIGIPTGPFPLGGKDHLLFPQGIPLPNGHFVVTAQVVRDVVVTGIYAFFLVAQALGWLWWQRRGRQPTPTAQLETSAFGRPLLRKV